MLQPIPVATLLLLPPSVQAETLLNEWEHQVPPVATLAHAPPAYAETRRAALAQLAALCQLLAPPAIANVDFDDLRAVLQGAHSVAVSTGRAEGPHRVALTVGQLMAGLHHLPAAPAHLARQVLVIITSPPAAELTMDELTEILESIQGQMGQQAEMVFGHHEAPADAPDLQIGLLIGYNQSGNR